MNDPHVVALEYRIEHGPAIDWSQAKPLNVQNDSFDIQVSNGRVRFLFNKHYATEREARDCVEERYIPNWEFKAVLERGPDTFRLVFDRSDIEDRNPLPGPRGLSLRASAGVPEVRVGLAPPMPTWFPEPPRIAIRRTPDINSMYDRYLGHLEGREPLPGMANFCLTVLAQIAGGRRSIANRFAVSKKVISKIGDLSANKGGANARKADGLREPYSSEEKRFLRSAIKVLIRRAAEVEYSSDQSRTKITLDDFHLGGLDTHSEPVKR